MLSNWASGKTNFFHAHRRALLLHFPSQRFAKVGIFWLILGVDSCVVLQRQQIADLGPTWMQAQLEPRSTGRITEIVDLISRVEFKFGSRANKL